MSDGVEPKITVRPAPSEDRFWVTSPVVKIWSIRELEAYGFKPVSVYQITRSHELLSSTDLRYPDKDGQSQIAVEWNYETRSGTLRADGCIGREIDGKRVEGGMEWRMKVIELIADQYFRQWDEA